jgi:hypothetical protein
MGACKREVLVTKEQHVGLHHGFNRNSKKEGFLTVSDIQLNLVKDLWKRFVKYIIKVGKGSQNSFK